MACGDATIFFNKDITFNDDISHGGFTAQAIGDELQGDTLIAECVLILFEEHIKNLLGIEAQRTQ